MTINRGQVPGQYDVTGRLGNGTLFFGHQSVGSNILEGIQTLDTSVSIIGVDSDEFAEKDSALFHAYVGTNGHPQSKIDEFTQFVSMSPRTFDVAMMKLCYVDIKRDTDVSRLFDYYVSVMDKLQNTMPNLIIVHFTTPLRSIRLGIRSRLRNLMRQDLIAAEDNAKREAYNSLIRARYEASGRLFDIARIESTSPDGRISALTYRNEVIRTLYPGFTVDGGHLNLTGQQIVAGRLLKFLGSCLSGRAQA